MSVEDDIKTLSSSPSEEAETAEDIIFTLFGPRTWEHNGELLAGTLETLENTSFVISIGLLSFRIRRDDFFCTFRHETSPESAEI